MRAEVALAGFLLMACVGGDTDVVVASGRCDEITAEQGRTLCVHAVPDLPTWTEISLPGGSTTALASTKYSVAVDAADPSRVLYLNANQITLHNELLPLVYPDRYPSLTPLQYLDLALYPETRVFWSGVVTEWLVNGTDVVYAFTVWDDPAVPSSTVTEADVRAVVEALEPTFGIGALAFEPTTPAQRDRASRFGEDLAIFDPSDFLSSEAYLEGVAYGRLRRVQVVGLGQEPAREDIAVFDVPPAELFVPISGALTATRQAALSHLAVRTGARGVPNCYHKDAWELAAPWDGQLVKYTCSVDGIAFEAATAEEVEAWQLTKRPEPIVLRPPNGEDRSMPEVGTVPMSTPEERQYAVSTWGSKGTQLSLAYDHVDPDLQFNGLLIPFGFGMDHLQTHGWEVDLGDGPAWHSFRETAEAWVVDPAFVDDPVERRQRLEAIVAAVIASPPDAEVAAPVVERIVEVIPAETWIRLRSSSNAEDSLWFNGAGLYTSVKACPADDLDDDEVGPSHCWPPEDDEVTVASALAHVWSSLFKPAAWEERDWFGMNQLDAAMGVLVNDRSVGEQLTIVAFSGAPTTPGENRILLQAQPGNIEIVNPDPGVLPEELLIPQDPSEPIVRVRPSTLAWDGQWFVTDEQAREVAATLVQLVGIWPIDMEVPSDVTVLLDTEWKVMGDGRLILKQVRPFPRREPVTP